MFYRRTRTSTLEGFRILRDWYARKTIVEVISFSLSNWPMLMKGRIISFTTDLLAIELIEEHSEKKVRSLNLAGAEFKWAQPEDNLAPFEGVSATEFKGFLYMKLKDGKHLVMAEKCPQLVS